MTDDDEDDEGNNNEHLLLPNASLEHDRDGGEGRGVSAGPVGGPSRPGDGSAVLLVADIADKGPLQVDQGVQVDSDSRKIEEKIDKILHKLMIDSPDLSKMVINGRILKKLDIVEASVSLKDTVRDVKEVTEKLSALFVVETVAEAEASNDYEDLFVKCKSVKEIEIKAAEFKYCEEYGVMICLVCEARFRYSSDQPRDFKGCVQSRAFRDLKKVLKRHLLTGKHKKKVQSSQALAEIEFKEVTRNKKIGMTLGRLAYKKLHTGSSYIQFPLDVAMLSKEGVDVGDFNHNEKFCAKFGEVVGEVVKKRVIDFLTSPLPQTGLPPPVKVAADKATHKHWSNNLTGVLTVIPGSENLIQAIFLAAPRCERSTGDALSKDISGTISSFYIAPSQVTGLAGDGAYSHCKVGEKLDERLGISGFHDTDFCHLAGRVDINLREKKGFEWVTKFVLIVSKTNKMINWGMAWHIFFKVYSLKLTHQFLFLVTNVPIF